MQFTDLLQFLIPNICWLVMYIQIRGIISQNKELLLLISQNMKLISNPEPHTQPSNQNCRKQTSKKYNINPKFVLPPSKLTANSISKFLDFLGNFLRANPRMNSSAEEATGSFDTSAKINDHPVITSPTTTTFTDGIVSDTNTKTTTATTVIPSYMPYTKVPDAALLTNVVKLTQNQSVDTSDLSPSMTGLRDVQPVEECISKLTADKCLESPSVESMLNTKVLSEPSGVDIQQLFHSQSIPKDLKSVLSLLPYFDGVCKNYRKFKFKFSIIVNHLCLTDQVKSLMLFLSLENEVVDCLSLAADHQLDYGNLWFQLDREYSRPQHGVLYHEIALNALSRWSTCDSFYKLKRLYRFLNIHYRALERTESSKYDLGIGITVLSKLEGEVASKVSIHMIDHTGNSVLPGILDILRSEIDNSELDELVHGSVDDFTEHSSSIINLEPNFQGVGLQKPKAVEILESKLEMTSCLKRSGD